MSKALGMIEAVGLSTAMVALDAAIKCADVSLLGTEKVIGAGKMISITLHLSGDVAAVQAAVDAGRDAGNRVGSVLAATVVPRPHEELGTVFSRYEKNVRAGKGDAPTAPVPPGKPAATPAGTRTGTNRTKKQ